MSLKLSVCISPAEQHSGQTGKQLGSGHAESVSGFMRPEINPGPSVFI